MDTESSIERKKKSAKPDEHQENSERFNLGSLKLISKTGKKKIESERMKNFSKKNVSVEEEHNESDKKNACVLEENTESEGMKSGKNFVVEENPVMEEIKKLVKSGRMKASGLEAKYQFVGMKKVVKSCKKKGFVVEEREESEGVKVLVKSEGDRKNVSVEGMKNSVRSGKRIIEREDTNTLSKVRKRIPHESSLSFVRVNRGPPIPDAEIVWVAARRGALFAWDLEFLEANKCRFEPGDEFILLPDQLMEYEGYTKEEAKEKMGAIHQFLNEGGWKCIVERGTYLDHTGEKEPPQCLLGD